MLLLAAPAEAQPITLQLLVQSWTGYTVESSPDLQQWAAGKRVFVTHSVLEIVETNTAGVAMRFFRARETSNDAFTDRFTIEGFPATVFGSDVNATAEPGEPELGFGQTVWWTWTAPMTTQVGLCLAGTDFPADIGVYTGDVLTNLVRVPFTYVTPGGLFFDATAGTTYQLQLGPTPAFWGAVPPPQGPLEFTLAPPPPNDDFSHRIVLAGSEVATNMSSFLATIEPFETNGYDHSIWWSWTAPTNGSVGLTVDCQNYGFPPQAFAGHADVFTGNTSAELIAVPTITSFGPAVTFHFDAVANTTYQIAQNGDAGNDSLQLHLSPNRYLIKTYASPLGTGTISSSPAPDPDGLYAAGSVVTLIAQPLDGYRFVGWTGSLTNASTNLQVMVDHTYKLEADFESEHRGQFLIMDSIP
jgi:hypothetical protein